ncbi:MAG: hypothetical protein AAGA16_21260 [Cyanobacteria bacterium P01_E01_bin.35]
MGKTLGAAAKNISPIKPLNKGGVKMKMQISAINPDNHATS